MTMLRGKKPYSKGQGFSDTLFERDLGVSANLPVVLIDFYKDGNNNLGSSIASMLDTLW